MRKMGYSIQATPQVHHTDHHTEPPHRPPHRATPGGWPALAGLGGLHWLACTEWPAPAGL